MFERKPNELPPFLYNIGDKIMGYQTSIEGHMIVGGEIVERKQSTSFLDVNEYKVKLEPELLEGCEEGESYTWWIDEKEAKHFKQDVWKKAVGHWIEHCKLKSRSYLEYIRMHKALREEPDDITDEQLQKELDERHGVKKENKKDGEKKEEVI